MTDRFVEPEYRLDAFNCPHCGAYAHHFWDDWKGIERKYSKHTGDTPVHVIYRASCQRCQRSSVWVDQRMVYPGDMIGQPPSDDMPEEVQEIYNEARGVAKASNRAAAALLRVAIEKLANKLQPGPGTLNDKIGQMVKEGLGVEVQRMLDSVRVIGNDTLHRGEIDLNEAPETVPLLMFCVNRIVERMITDPRQIEELYQLLPKDKLHGIQNRDR